MSSTNQYKFNLNTMNGIHAVFQASKQIQTHQTYHKSSQNNWHSSPSYTIDLFNEWTKLKRLLHNPLYGEAIGTK